MRRTIPCVALCCVLAACSSGAGSQPSTPPPAVVSTTTGTSSRAPHVAPSSPGVTADAARCAPLVNAWRHQLEVMEDAREWAEKVDDPAVKARAQETARKDQEIADGMHESLVTMGCTLA